MVGFMLFKIGSQVFAYPTDSVLETVKISRVFTVPKSPPYIRGVINLRNQVISLIDSGHLLWGKELNSDTAIILEINGEPAGLLVDKVMGIVDVEDTDIRTKEEIELMDVKEEFVKGIFEMDEDIVFIMDLSSVVATERKRRAKKISKSRESTDRERRVDLEGFVIFSSGREWFALPVDEVREIVDFPSNVSKIPQAPDYIEGVFLLRREEIVLISLNRLLAIPSKEEKRVIIGKVNSSIVGVGVEDVKEIKWVSKDSILPIEREGTKGVIVLDEGKRLALILSLKDLLREEEIEGLAESSEEEEAQEVKAMKSFVHFNIGTVDLAIPIEKVKEVIEVRDLTDLPKAAEYIKGVYNLRNSVIAIISLAKRLAVKDATESDKVVVLEDVPVGLTVSDLKGILKTEEESIQSADDLTGLDEELLEGVIKTEEGEVIFILNTDAIVKEEDIKLIEEKVIDKDE